MKCVVALCTAIVLMFSGFASVCAQEDEADSEEFSLRLFQEVAKDHPDSNILVSPFSVKTALTMTYTGAAGDTKKAMAKVLGFEGLGSVEIIAARAKAVLSSLQTPGGGTKLEIANGLFGEKSIKFKGEFLSLNKQYFDAEINSLDFKSADAVKTINDWVSEKTHDKIPTIIDQIGNDAILYLINAIYFKGAWQHRFDAAATTPADFHLVDGTTKKVPMMNLSRSDFRYYQTGDFQVINLPYSDGRLSMYVVLPGKETKLAAFEASLSKQMWEDLMMRLGKREGSLTLPKFKIEDKITLNDALQKMGMEIAFDTSKADFSEMADVTPLRIFISRVLHKTFMEVNEEGTEAAAATAVEMSVTSAPAHPPQPFMMVVDRPFIVALRDNKTGSLLFMGHVANPAPESP